MGALTDGAEPGEEPRGEEPMEAPRSRDDIPDPKLLPPDGHPRLMDRSSRWDEESLIAGEDDCGTLRPGVITRTREPSTAGAELYTRSRTPLEEEDAAPESRKDPLFSGGITRRSLGTTRIVPGIA